MPIHLAGGHGNAANLFFTGVTVLFVLLLFNALKDELRERIKQR